MHNQGAGDDYRDDLSIPRERWVFDCCSVTVVNKGALVVCVSNNVTLGVVAAIVAMRADLRAERMAIVFRLSGFATARGRIDALSMLHGAQIADVTFV